MATASDVVTAILRAILVTDAESPIEASEAQDTIFAMNNFMLAQDALGITLGYTVVTDLGDEITVPPGAIQGIVFNLAEIMAAQFDVPVPVSVSNGAITGLRAMRRLSLVKQKTRFPCTLPIGSGNEGSNFGTIDRFYPCPDDEILAETSGAILQESGTDGAV